MDESASGPAILSGQRTITELAKSHLARTARVKGRAQAQETAEHVLVNTGELKLSDGAITVVVRSAALSRAVYREFGLTR